MIVTVLAPISKLGRCWLAGTSDTGSGGCALVAVDCGGVIGAKSRVVRSVLMTGTGSTGAAIVDEEAMVGLELASEDKELLFDQSRPAQAR